MIEPLDGHTFPLVSVEPCMISAMDGVEHMGSREQDLVRWALVCLLLRLSLETAQELSPIYAHHLPPPAIVL